MKVQRLIEKYGEKFKLISKDYPYDRALSELWYDIKNLDEPKPVKVKQFVADWITHSKNIGRSLFGAMSIFEENTEIKKWMQWAENQETFAIAWLNGYEVEKEKRYRVKVKGNIKENMLVYGELLERYFFTKNFSLDNAIYFHTRKELEEAGFGWVFDCPGIEIEEVAED